MKLVDLLKSGCERNPDSNIVQDSGQSMTYSDIYSDCLHLSKILQEYGMKPGVKIGIFLENSKEFLMAFFAVSAASCTIVPLFREMTIYELSGSIHTADLSAVISDFKTSSKLLSSLQDVTIIGVEYCDDGLKVQVIKACSTVVDEDNKDVALMVTTSGTTGKPKHVLLTDHQLISNLHQYLKVMKFSDRETVYCALPFSHIYCITAQILTHISRGDGYIISKGRFFIKDFFRSVQEQGVTITAFVPYLAILMADYPTPENYHLESLKQITLSGSKTPACSYLKLKDLYPNIRFINTYGMSEAGSRIAIAAPNPSRYPVDSVGKALPGVSIKIVEIKGDTLPVGKVGEICIKSSGLMKGYYRDPGLTSDVLSHGWFKTGDLGKMDSKGNLFIAGRLKEIIISGGKNISPYEIEECLLKHPKVLEAAVVAKKHPTRQEVPYAFIVCTGNASIGFSEFVAHCRQYLSSYKIPHGFEIIEVLPKISASKINRRQLAQISSEEPLL